MTQAQTLNNIYTCRNSKNVMCCKNLREKIFNLFSFYLLFYLNPSLVQSCYKECIQGYFGVPVYFINDGRVCEHEKYTNEYYTQNYLVTYV